jgi:hypothetical protein
LDAVPRVLGIDDAGREVLTFVPGATVGAAAVWPAWAVSDALLVQVGAWLRRYHEAVSGFRPPGVPVWRTEPRHPGPGEVLCHHDVAPYNVVWTPGVAGAGDSGAAAPGAGDPGQRDQGDDRSPVAGGPQPGDQGAGSPVAAGGTGHLAAVVDWDAAGPGPALGDVAFLAWHALPLRTGTGWPTPGAAEVARRVTLLAEAYGTSSGDVIAAIGPRLTAATTRIRAAAAGGDAGMARLVAAGVPDEVDRRRADVAPLLRAASRLL